MSTLVVGFDSAWTPHHAGGMVSVVLRDDGTPIETGEPEPVKYDDAASRIMSWQDRFKPHCTVIMLDQPNIVNNAAGQRPVEHVVCSSVSRYAGGMQPANTARKEMFGCGAPVWSFLQRLGGAADPFHSSDTAGVLETYPVLTLIALGWTRNRKLPKYNPQRRKTFSLQDWQYVCTQLLAALERYRLERIAQWLEHARRREKPRKTDQDCLDACICLLTGLHWAEGRPCLIVGEMESGYIVVPHGDQLFRELEERCIKTGRPPGEWLRVRAAGLRHAAANH